MMFKLEQIGETHTDETTNFKVVLDKPYTVSSFIDTVLKNTSDWGYIGIKNQNSFLEILLVNIDTENFYLLCLKNI